jgi:hypothetical protein
MDAIMRKEEKRVGIQNLSSLYRKIVGKLPKNLLASQVRWASYSFSKIIPGIQRLEHTM